MPMPGRTAPAISWRAFFVCTALLRVGAVLSGAPANAPPELIQAGKPNPKEAARLIQQFRNSGLPGDFYLEIELRSLPRRGTGPIFKGQWWGSRNAEGALTRIE